MYIFLFINFFKILKVINCIYKFNNILYIGYIDINIVVRYVFFYNILLCVVSLFIKIV